MNDHVKDLAPMPEVAGSAEYLKSASAALNEKLAAARAYHGAQSALMQLIVDGADDKEVGHQLVVLRTARAMFQGTKPFDQQSDPKDVDRGAIHATLAFVELLVAIRSNEQLILEWLQTAERSSLTPIAQYVDTALEVSADPRYDIYVVAGEQAEEIADALRERECIRILRWDELRDEAAEDPDTIDVRKTDHALTQLPELSVCRPQRVWCLWGIEVHCPMSIREALDARLRKVMINRNTINALGASWAKQFIRNLPSLVRHGRDSMKLVNSLKGSGAIVIGAGPSLDTHIEWIKAQSPKPVIICAYKALKSLSKHGITPDFVAMLDPNQQVRHIEGVDLSGIAGFVAEVSVWPEVLARVDRPILPYFAGDGTRILSEVFGKVKLPTIPTGGSVFHTGLQIAKLIGCTEVTLIGADFGFPDDRLYADGSGTGDKLTLAPDKRSYLRQPLDQRARKGILIQATANNGSQLATTLELDAYRLWTEEFLRDWQRHEPETKFFNLAPNGARIEGAEFVEAAVHRASPAVGSAIEVTEGAPHLVAPNRINRGLAGRLRKKIDRLRALRKACARAIGAARKKPATDLSMYGGVVKRASACPEVSLLLNKQLTELDEQAKRTTIDVPQRLLSLIEEAEQQAAETADLYAGVAAALAQKPQEIHS